MNIPSSNKRGRYHYKYWRLIYKYLPQQQNIRISMKIFIISKSIP